MLDCQRFGAVRVFCDDRIEDGRVLSPYLARQLRVAQHVPHRAAQEAPMGLGGAGQQGVAGAFVEEGVEGEVVRHLLGDVSMRRRSLASLQYLASGCLDLLRDVGHIAHA